MRSFSIEAIADHVGLTAAQVRSLIESMKMLRFPDRIDNDDALVNAYVSTYRLRGRAGAQLEVYRRIKLAKEIRILKEYLDNPATV